MAASARETPPTIVVGYDGSASARAAVDYAARRAGPDGNVFVVHAYGPPSDWLGRPNYQRVLSDHEERARAVLDELVLDDDPLLETNFETEMLADDPATAIVDVAKAREADEIVIGSRGHGALRSAFLGSVSMGVLQHAGVPVVVIPMAAAAG